ncbi:hypothetical protein EBQ93_02190 [bacterium]|nr:hypothetical protein [bacterium]
MNKNIMMVVLLMMGISFGINVLIGCSGILYRDITLKRITFENKTANTFSFVYQIGLGSGRCYGPLHNRPNEVFVTHQNPSWAQPVTLSVNDTRDNTQTLTMVSNSGKFTVSTQLYSGRSKKYITVSKTYTFTDFNETDTFSISLKGGDIHIYDPSGKEIQAQP